MIMMMNREVCKKEKTEAFMFLSLSVVLSAKTLATKDK